MPFFTDIYRHFNGDDNTCKTIAENACEQQPHNYGVIFTANLLTLISDMLSSTKLIIPWLFASAGIPSFFSGLLVPVREAFSMLPQIFIGMWIRQFSTHKGVYIISSLFQMLALLCMMLVAMKTTGSTAGWLVLLCVLFYSLSRAFSSVAVKDVLGKTISKEKRGQISGHANRFAGAFTLVLGIVVTMGITTSTITLTIFVGMASVAMLVSALLYTLVKEFPHSVAPKNQTANAIPTALMRTDLAFRQFIITRALLMSSGLATPYIVFMAQQRNNSWVGLGVFIAISGLASFVSSAFWGKESDKDSKQVLTQCAIATSVICTLSALAFWLPTAVQSYVYGLCFFLISVTHQGVRIGRSTYVVDLAKGDKRTLYVSVSNTLIGVLIVLVGLISALLSQVAVWLALLFFGMISLIAVGSSRKMVKV